MSVPILRQGRYLIVSLQPSLADAELLRVREELAEEVGQTRALGVVLDLTAIDVLDSFATRTLRTIVATVRLRGAKVVVVGIQPSVAYAMVQLGLDLPGVPTALDLEAGLALLGRSPQEGHGR